MQVKKDSFCEWQQRSIRLAVLNLRKRKKVAIIMLFLAALVALFTNMGSKIMIDMGSIYETHMERLHGAHHLVVMDEIAMKDSYTTYLNQDQRISEYEVRDCVNLKNTEIQYDGGIIDSYFIIENFNTRGKMNQVIIENPISNEAKNTEVGGIYAPKTLMSKGFKTGDLLNFKEGKWYRTYQIKGFFQDTNLGFENCGGIRFYLEDEAYKEMYLNHGLSKEILIRCKDTTEATAVFDEFLTYIKEHAESISEYQSIFSGEFSVTKLAYSLFSGMGAGLLIGFTVIIIVIMLLVVRFRIKNNINESLQDIGILKASGYTQKEVTMAYAYEYVVTTFIGTVIGTVLSYLILPFCGQMLMAATGLSWISSMHLMVDWVVIILVTGVIYLTTYIAARQSKKYDIRTALMKGEKSHSYHKNRFSLEKGGSLQFRLALKECFHRGRQNGMVVICIAGVTFAMILGMMLYVTFVGNIKLITQTLGMEIADVEVEIAKGADPEEVRKLIEELDGVRKTNLSYKDKMFLDDIPVVVDTYEDYSKLETENVYEGRFCKYDNEVVVTGVFAKQLNKYIGDSVIIESQGYRYEYIITGISQSANNLGRVIKLTKEGYLKLNPPGKLTTCHIYLEDGVTSSEFIPMFEAYFGLNEEAKNGGQQLTEEEAIYERYRQVAEEKMRIIMKTYGIKELDYSIYVDGVIISGNSRNYMIQKVTDMYLTGKSTMSAVQLVLTMVVSCILIVTICIITLLTSLIIGALLIQKKVYFGTLRALGYTTRQLMLQITLSLMPAVIGGVTLGTGTCLVLAGPLTTKLLSVTGVSKMQFQLNPWYVIGTSVVIIGIAFIATMLHAYKVRKITVHELLTE